jgi:hypothetical protein
LSYRFSQLIALVFLSLIFVKISFLVDIAVSAPLVRWSQELLSNRTFSAFCKVVPWSNPWFNAFQCLTAGYFQNRLRIPVIKYEWLWCPQVAFDLTWQYWQSLNFKRFIAPVRKYRIGSHWQPLAAIGKIISVRWHFFVIKSKLWSEEFLMLKLESNKWIKMLDINSLTFKTRWYDRIIPLSQNFVALPLVVLLSILWDRLADCMPWHLTHF